MIYADFTAAVDGCSGIDSENRQTGLCILDASEIEVGRAWAERHAEPTALLGETALSAWIAGARARQALFFARAAQVRNPRLCRSLRAALIRRGARFLEDCPVAGPRLEEGIFTGFDTARGLVPAAYGVVAAGAWSSRVLGPLAPQSVFPVGGQMILMRGAPGLLPSVLLEKGRYAIPRADGRILVGSTLEPGAATRQRISKRRAHYRPARHRCVRRLANCPLKSTGLACDRRLPMNNQ